MSTVISVENLNVCYRTASGTVRAANGVDFSIERGECLGLVGESGSGKSTTALALMRLIRPPGYIESGRVLLGDRDLLSLTEEEMRQARFARIALIPQGAMNSLNPVMRVGTQIADTITAHENDIARSALDDRAASLLELVDLDPGVARSYPHELSGGMKQRVCLAIGVKLEPEVIIADEPTSALDVVMQKQVMETLRQVQADLGAAMVLVGHDMGLMAQCADRIGVMYAGRCGRSRPCRRGTDGTAASLRQIARSLPAVSGNQGRLPRYPRSAALAARSTARMPFPPPLSRDPRSL